MDDDWNIIFDLKKNQLKQDAMVLKCIYVILYGDKHGEAEKDFLLDMLTNEYNSIKQNHDSRPGRKKGYGLKNRALVVYRVILLMDKGRGREDAIADVAALYDVSFDTVKRYYDKKRAAIRRSMQCPHFVEMMNLACKVFPK